MVNSADTFGHDKRSRVWRTFTYFALAVAAVVLLLNFGSYVVVGIHAIGYPFELDYGEGIVWEQMRLILAGRGYTPINGFPAIVFHYPPGYHLAAGLLAKLIGVDQLAAGRALSFASMLTCAGFVGTSTAYLAKERSDRTLGVIVGLIAAGVVFTFSPVQGFSFLMRVDMLSFAFGFAGFYCGLVAITRPKAIYAAAVLFVAAIFCKQTAITGPTSVFLVLLFLRPRTAWTGIATILALGLTALAAVTWMTDGGFLRHIVLYNLNRGYLANFIVAIRSMSGMHCIYLVLALVGIACWVVRLTPDILLDGGWRGIRERFAACPPSAARLMALVYLALTTVMLTTSMKSGASVNYFIEWSCVVAIFVGLCVVEAAALGASRPAKARYQIWSVLVLIAIAGQAVFLFGKADERFSPTIAQRREAAQLAELVRDAPGPVVGDSMVAILRGGKRVVLEPAVFAELASRGKWDERPFVKKIESRDFSFFVTLGNPGDMVFNSRYTPAVTKAVTSAYPVQREIGGFVVRFPPGPLPRYAAKVR